MQYRKLGGSGLRASVFCVGTGLFGEPTSDAEAARILSAAVDNGINFVDTAPSYTRGQAEAVLGRVLGHTRNKWIVATKIAAGNTPDTGLNRAWMTRSVNESLDRLHMDYVDILYLHRDDPTASLEETIAVMGEIIRAGKARFFGLSNYAGWRIAEIIRLADQLGTPRPVVGQPQYNIVTRTPEVEYLPACAYYGMAVVPYSPLARGVLTGKYLPGVPPSPDTRAARKDPRMMQTVFFPESLRVAQKVRAYAQERGMTASEFSLNWLLNHRSVASIVIGPKDMQQTAGYLAALAHEFTAEDEKFVDTLVPSGHCAAPGYTDPLYPVTGRVGRRKAAG